MRIVREECGDEEVNALVWKCLGYRVGGDGAYGNDAVFPKWRAKYPEPPDLVGATRRPTTGSVRFPPETCSKIRRAS